MLLDSLGLTFMHVIYARLQGFDIAWQPPSRHALICVRLQKCPHWARLASWGPPFLCMSEQPQCGIAGAGSLDTCDDGRDDFRSFEPLLLDAC